MADAAAAECRHIFSQPANHLTFRSALAQGFAQGCCIELPQSAVRQLTDADRQKTRMLYWKALARKGKALVAHSHQILLERTGVLTDVDIEELRLKRKIATHCE